MHSDLTSRLGWARTICRAQLLEPRPREVVLDGQGQQPRGTEPVLQPSTRLKEILQSFFCGRGVHRGDPPAWTTLARQTGRCS